MIRRIATAVIGRGIERAAHVLKCQEAGARRLGIGTDAPVHSSITEQAMKEVALTRALVGVMDPTPVLLGLTGDLPTLFMGGHRIVGKIP
jgi:hypothetical protein